MELALLCGVDVVLGLGDKSTSNLIIYESNPKNNLLNPQIEGYKNIVYYDNESVPLLIIIV